MTNTETCSDITYKLLQESSSHPCFPILHTLSLFILTLGSSIIGYRPVVFIVWLLFTGVVFSSMSYWWPSQLLTWSLSILSTIKLSTRVYGHLVPWSYPLRGRRLRAATALAHVHIRTPTSLSFRLVNTTSTCSSKSTYVPGVFATCPNTSDVVGCKGFVAIQASSRRPCLSLILLRRKHCHLKLASTFAIAIAITNQTSFILLHVTCLSCHFIALIDHCCNLVTFYAIISTSGELSDAIIPEWAECKLLWSSLLQSQFVAMRREHLLVPCGILEGWWNRMCKAK